MIRRDFLPLLLVSVVAAAGCSDEKPAEKSASERLAEDELARREASRKALQPSRTHSRQSRPGATPTFNP